MPNGNPPDQSVGPPPCLHQAIGGTGSWRRLTETFYGHVARDPRLRHLFPGKTLHCAIEELTAFLVQLFGGPSGDTQRRWWVSLRESHQRFSIRAEDRAAWLENMHRTLQEIPLDPHHRTALLDFFEYSSTYVVNTGEPVPVPPQAGHPSAASSEIAGRWQSQCLLDQLVSALRARQTAAAFALLEDPVLRERFEFDRSGLTALLGLMLQVNLPEMRSYVVARVSSDPGLARERFAGQTLLHRAAALGDAPIVELLLRLGADPDEKDGGEHTPLYSVANEYQGKDGGNVVRILVQAGAEVDADGGVKRCTPLHMAARRGHVETAEALLDAGAAIEARDSLGETPLRRAVNCNKVQVAALLLRRSADPHSVGSKRLTPLLAAKSPAMKELFQSRQRH
ncbi:MAG: ankyrin repeat domain-containing protein [Paludibaculum sp.]